MCISYTDVNHQVEECRTSIVFVGDIRKGVALTDNTACQCHCCTIFYSKIHSSD